MSESSETTSQFDLDLDAIQPDTKKVRLGGVVYDVYQPDLKDLVLVAKLAKKANNPETTNDEKVDMVEGLHTALCSFMPALKDDGVKLSMKQMNGLLEFIFGMATPAQKEALAEANATPADSSQKKME